MVLVAANVPLLIDAGKKNVSTFVEWGRRRMMEQAFEEAIKQFDTALDIKPGISQALVCRGFCHLSLGDPLKAQRDFLEVIKRDACFSRNVYVLIAICFTRDGEYQTAVRYLSRCLQHFPSFHPALLARAELHLKQQNFDLAIADFRAVLADDSAHLVARRGLGDACRGLANMKEALRHYNHAIEDAMQLLAKQEEQEDQDQQQQQSVEESQSHDGDTFTEPSEGLALTLRSSSAPTFCAPGEDSQADDGDVAMVSTQERSDEVATEQVSAELERSGAISGGPSKGSIFPAAPDPDSFLSVSTSPLGDPERLQSFLMELLLRRAFLLRLSGKLEEAGSDILEVLQKEPDHGLALFWYAKVLLEQQRQREAPSYLQASIQHHEPTRGHAHALLGALAASSPDPDCDLALRHLKEAVRLQPQNQGVRVTLWIVSAQALLQSAPPPQKREAAQRALGCLEKALAMLHQGSLLQSQPSGRSADDSQLAKGSSSKAVATSGAVIIMRGGKGLTPRVHVAGSGTSAAAALSARGKGESAEWSAARAVVQRKQELAQGDDLELALSCSSYLQLVAREPRLQVAPLPPTLFALQAIALCELGRWEEAVSACRAALALDPGDEATQYNMNLAGGILRSEANEAEASVGSFTKAIRLRPTCGEARVHRALALALAARGQNSREAEKSAQLLRDALSDLEAARQQADIAGTEKPSGLLRLQVACLCSLGQFAEAAQVLGDDSGRGSSSSSTSHPQRGVAPSPPVSATSPRWAVVHAEVLLLQHQCQEAIGVANRALANDDASDEDRVEALLVRGRCWAELSDAEHAFQDFREALELTPHNEAVHSTSGELFLLRGCFSEAITAFNTVAKLTETASARLLYLRALAFLGMQHVNAAMKDIHRAIHQNPSFPAALRVRDGLGALQMLLEKDYTHARVRFNTLLHAAHSRSPNGNAEPSPNESFPSLLLPHELVLYRGVCALYVHDTNAAIQDFEAAANFVKQANAALGPALEQQEEAKLRRLPVEVSSQQGAAAFNCEVLYNLALCQLLACDRGAALETCEKLLESAEALQTQHAFCLIWFLIGLCRMALGSFPPGDIQDAFTRSYAFHPCFVDDFLRRHDPDVGRVVANAVPPPAMPGRASRPAIAVPFRPIGGCPVPPGSRMRNNRDVCDADPDAICCLRLEPGRLSPRLQPLRIEVKDVVIW
eukprot:CAMPEP_0178451074 /NCGR_PEP_ID=MMETSP0689_2-20121128/43478_1 /TAXON_ID=160604 /ORGANISM="Amphidinium massartii, Strain CS-259" /LENGTH=1191 /DNA_ID=CAMNT_0020076611 /DNA_START=91 /DNA_END=3663 /DNA_ORIENTATION=+